MSGSARLSTVITELLPHLRRYARALTGTQASGDQYAAETLDRLLVDRTVLDTASSLRVALFQAFFQNWRNSRITSLAQLGHLTPFAREALLLKSIEAFTISEIAEIMAMTTDTINDLLDIAREEMHNATRGSIMVIEDDALIALDLKKKIVGLGHSVFGIARTRADAVAMTRHGRPDMILSDIQLADGSSGTDAVADIIAEIGYTPVLFVTGFPERLLTGVGDEPAFVVSKPYEDDQMRSAIGQAMVFASLERAVA